ncbi:MAG: S-layer homology domain-containing protein [Firmicutes bacterium]|nr:S-layer homology domain-containing protein [Bacillota bacterium]
MKKYFFVLALLVCFLFAAPLSAGEVFSDVNSGDWFYPEVTEAYNKGLVAGTSPTTFSPNQSMTRGQFVTILGRMEGIDPNDYILGFEHNFTDLKESYYIPYVTWAYENGIVAGETETRFAPDKAITREQIAAILDRYVKLLCYQLPQAPALDKFNDAGNISGYAKSSMEAMRLYGIIKGDENGNGLPQVTASRAEGTCMLLRFYNLIIPATEQFKMGDGYCRLLCASAPAGNFVTNSEEHDKNLAALRPSFASYLDSNESLGGVVHAKWQGKFYYFGVVQKTVASGNMNIYRNSKVIILDESMKYVGKADISKCQESTYGIYSIKPYYTPQGIFIYIATSSGSETTTFDMVLVDPDKYAYLSFSEILLQIKRDPGDGNKIKIRKMYVNENNNGFYLNKQPWETIDFTKFPYVLGYTGK